MKIAVCGSMSFSPEMLDLGERLEKLGHVVELPRFTEEYAALKKKEEMHGEAVSNKREFDLIRRYFDIVKNSDGILVYNPSKNDIENYVGGNTFLEMGFAHVLDKKIFFYNPIPDMFYRDEMEAMEPVVLDGDLEKLL